ncbi:uncharacterized protein LOC111700824 [Eurytemora carolleeae]|uniref:uncharacterized protein LOC111700824 n=1 Tax=Eurytemora carolleeae TaxID=1294199 RepID=UPI000C78961A|nr:uncharacterized protein LOC111700824 [Eurytemora carolleeae]|eukprot:XP_023327643.1 uncharacterized protein LOC111700824 [Eurytemora affinis]
MSNFLFDSETNVVPRSTQLPTQPIDAIFEGTQAPEEDKWRNILLPPGADGATGLSKDAMPLDLGTLLKVLDEHNKDGEKPADYSTWQLVMVQGLLLSALVIVSVGWACCCKKRCFQAAPTTVQEAFRKLSNTSTKSRDFPPSYSQADLHTLAMSVHDYLYPPPQYPDLHSRKGSGDLDYLDLEAGHTRLARLSFSGQSPQLLAGLPRLYGQRSSVSSLSTDSRKSSCSQDSLSSGSRKNSIMKDPNSRRSSTSQDSRKSSRISFSESVECSNGQTRRLSGTQNPDPSRRSSSSSVSSDGSRKSSSSSLSRKNGLSHEYLNEELMKKLERIELEDSLDTTSSSLETVVELEDEKPEPSLETVVEIEVENTEPEPSQSKPAQSNPILFL